tara:strand:+ start:414 stop:686 length:273 start_codon:yes stop_codon:yes gene_type:complete
MIKYLAMLCVLGFTFTGCATVGAVIDGGKDIATTTVDTVVSAGGNIGASALRDAADIVGTAADAAEGVVDIVVEEVDKQTDELQEPKEQK